MVAKTKTRASKKKTAKKKVVKKGAAKKKPVVKKKKAASGAARSRKKAATSRSKTTRKKTAKTTVKKKAGVKKKAAGKKKVAAKKKSVVKKATAVKKKAVTKKKAAAVPKTTKSKTAAKPKTKKKPTISPAARKAAYRKQFKPFRRLLVKKYESLVDSYAKGQGGARGRNDDGTEDYIDYAVSSYARDFSLSLSEMDRDRIRLVEEAIKRFDNWQYGACLACSKAIPLKRLEVESWAKYCIPCQELDDRGLLEPRDPSDGDDDVLGEGDGILAIDEDLSESGD